MFITYLHAFRTKKILLDSSGKLRDFQGEDESEGLMEFGGGSGL
jgi:hypothetical protein